MGIEKIEPTVRKERRFLEQDEILRRIANLINFVMKEKKITLEPDEVRQEDIVTLPQRRAQKIKEKREFLIGIGIKELEKMTEKGEIAPDFFHGVADKSEFVVRALEEVVKMASGEEEKKA